ncbi:MAG: IS66 family insertion sequence element accessory protein TnpB [Mangrovibacterium sp.]
MLKKYSSPLNGKVFVLINKSRNKIKLLHWQGSEFVLYYKSLKRSAFEIPSNKSESGSIILSYAQLVMLIDGIHKKAW